MLKQCIAFLLSSAVALLCSCPALASKIQSTGSANLSTSTNTTQTGSQGWDNLLVGTWYVPPANRLAYLVTPAAINPLAITDQTIFHILTAHNGSFSGVNSVWLSRSSALGWSKPQPMIFMMNGLVTPEGKIRITFTPKDSGQPPVTGVGTMELVDGHWRMTMQMSTGSAAVYVIHWAYMTKIGTAAPVGRVSDRWDWLLNTHWMLTDSQLGQFIFQIKEYHNGYLFGKGLGSTPISVVGSVTPEGHLLLVLTPASGSSVTRTGELMKSRDYWMMRFRSYEGTPAAGAARRLQW